MAENPVNQELPREEVEQTAAGAKPGINFQDQLGEKQAGKGQASGEHTLQYTLGPKALAKTDIMKTDFTVAEEMHRRTNQSSIDSERNRGGNLVS